MVEAGCKFPKGKNQIYAEEKCDMIVEWNFKFHVISIASQKYNYDFESNQYLHETSISYGKHPDSLYEIIQV